MKERLLNRVSFRRTRELVVDTLMTGVVGVASGVSLNNVNSRTDLALGITCAVIGAGWVGKGAYDIKKGVSFKKNIYMTSFPLSIRSF